MTDAEFLEIQEMDEDERGDPGVQTEVWNALVDARDEIQRKRAIIKTMNQELNELQRQLRERGAQVDLFGEGL